MNRDVRRPLVAGNWKMNMNYREGLEYFRQFTARELPASVDIMIAPSYLLLPHLARFFAGNLHWSAGAQDCSSHVEGAYTGEVSAAMIRSAAASHVIIGHSERREHHAERSSLLAEKVSRALEQKLKPVFCLGEKLEDREAGKEREVVSGQFEKALNHLGEGDWKYMTLAYEPVWAIGTGQTASPQQAQEMHAYLRQLIDPAAGDHAPAVRILYGGSVKPDNAADLFAMDDIDGALVGGASLDVEDFYAIVKAAE